MTPLLVVVLTDLGGEVRVALAVVSVLEDVVEATTTLGEEIVPSVIYARGLVTLFQTVFIASIGPSSHQLISSLVALLLLKRCMRLLKLSTTLRGTLTAALLIT